MDGSQSSSFIPKQPARGKVKTRGVRKIYIFAYISFVLFFGTLIATAGTFFYKVSVDAQLNAERQKLADLKGQFDRAELERIKDLEKQLDLAALVIDQHISVTAFFNALETSAIDSIDYEELLIERPEPTDITIALKGTTEDFNSILFQRSVIAGNPILTGATFEELSAQTTQSNVATDKKTVQFEIRQNTDPSTLPFNPRPVTAVPPVPATQPPANLPIDTNNTAL